MAITQRVWLFGTILLALISIVASQKLITLSGLLNTLSSSPTTTSNKLITGPVFRDTLPQLTIEKSNVPVIQKGNLIFAATDNRGGGGNHGGGGGGGGGGGRGGGYGYHNPFIRFIDGIARMYALRRLRCKTVSELYNLNFPAMTCTNTCPPSHNCISVDYTRPYSFGFCCPFYVTEYVVHVQTMMSRYGVISEYFAS